MSADRKNPTFGINLNVEVCKAPGKWETFNSSKHLPGSDINELERELKYSVVWMLREIEEYLREGA